MLKALYSPLSIAPMIDWTNTHFRVFMRILAPQALLYTEMQTVGAVQNKPERALLFNPIEYPLALQLGGSDPRQLALCAKIAEKKGFAEINLNLGCPSDRVQAGRFGACMMAERELAAECIAAMKDAVSIPVTAKTRIGIDGQDSYPFFAEFAAALIAAGSDKLVIHARKAWLRGLNPKQNRTIPPVNYSYVYQFKKDFSQIPIVINGNISTIEDITNHLNQVDGIMLGRLACEHPYAIAAIHHHVYPDYPLLSRSDLFRLYFNYLQNQLDTTPLSLLLKPVFNLAHGLPGAKSWKALLQMALKTKNVSFLVDALSWLQDFEEPYSIG